MEQTTIQSMKQVLLLPCQGLQLTGMECAAASHRHCCHPQPILTQRFVHALPLFETIDNFLPFLRLFIQKERDNPISHREWWSTYLYGCSKEEFYTQRIE